MTELTVKEARENLDVSLQGFEAGRLPAQVVTDAVTYLVRALLQEGV